jgi:hypothetical protein
MAPLSDLFEQQVLLSAEKQNKMLRRFGDLPWSLSAARGTLQFQGPRGAEFPMQFLGTASKLDNTWLWSWANEDRPVPEPLLKSAQALKQFGAANGIIELETPRLDLKGVDGGYFALLASGVLEASCYYAAEYEEGALYVLVSGHEIDRQPSLNAGELWGYLNQLFATYPGAFRPRAALEKYCAAKSLPIVAEGDAVRCRMAGGELFEARLDARGDLILSFKAHFPSWIEPGTRLDLREKG